MTGKHDDGRALKELQNSGADLSLPHTFVHYLYFRAKASAELARRKLLTMEYDAEMRPSADGANWLVLARRKVIPTEEAITTTRGNLSALARQFWGQYDGWEADPSERRHS